MNRKHERLHSEMERISAALPAVAAAASRAKDAIEPSLRRNSRQAHEIEHGDYDRQVTTYLPTDSLLDWTKYRFM